MESLLQPYPVTGINRAYINDKIPAIGVHDFTGDRQGGEVAGAGEYTHRTPVARLG